MKKKSIITGLLLLPGYWSFSQEFKIAETRTEELIMQDSVVHCSFEVLHTIVKPENKRWYFWFDGQNVHWNQGAWHGHLLHGPYRVFLPGGELVRAGQYAHGLKSGEWKTWEKGGTIKSIEQWEKGELHGKALYTLDDSTTIYKRFKHGVVQRVDTTGRRGDTISFHVKFKKLLAWISRRKSPETR
ncbi:MAG: hypothetical protein LBP56_01185 [Odoribacteraceae bacterium]|jgi:hypothetical protein|nr:hypothetical protein [Odoribacteraceae bacterium]